MRLYITVIFLIFLLTIAFIFGSQNNQIFTLNYLIAKTDITVASAVSLFTGLGFLLGLVTAFLFRLLRKLKTKQSN
ncbi:MAG: lipopolysaccharide assembly protein LapA domain-containing protein [Thalassotalea sp.]